jgi:uncharacterized protein (TIGR02757 family)
MTPRQVQHILGLKEFLDAKVQQYNQPRFLEFDPISIPHRFSKKQDIEIAGLFAAVLAWGQRVTIISKTNELLHWMDQSPYEFVQNHSLADLKPFTQFKHRTFNATDALYFIEALRYIYQQHSSLEDLFLCESTELHLGKGIHNFHKVFFNLPDHPNRTKKHLATPERKSACKRINMYLRWMVRKDKRGVDFGLWNRISPSQLTCPIDVHVERVARKLRLIKRKQVDWETALELTANLKLLDVRDPVKYDFALFGLGVEEKF